MSKVSIRVNDRAFSIGCESGEEAHVKALGETFNSKVSELVEQVGQIGDLRLFLMAALVIADELETAKSDLAKQIKPSDTQAQIEQINQKAIAALEQATEQVEQILEKLS